MTPLAPRHSKGPKYVTKTVSIDLDVWNQLVNRGINMSELVRTALEAQLRVEVAAEGRITSSPVTKSLRR